MKALVYQEKIPDINHSEERTENVVISITSVVLLHFHQQIETISTMLNIKEEIVL